MANGGFGNVSDPLFETLVEGLLQPLVFTDKADYAPGETATITGDGFAPGSEIVIQIADNPSDAGDDGDVDVYAPITVIADEDGAFTATWLVPIDNNGSGSGTPDALNATLNLTATGRDGQVATTTFTDSTNPPPVQTFYVPFPEDQVFAALNSIRPNPNNNPNYVVPVGPINTLISIAAIADNTIIYYDQQENGYDDDIANPSNLFSDPGNLGGTQIWGDRDISNGAAPGVTSNADDVINAGDVIVLSSDVDPDNLGVIDFDGGDKIAATKTVAITRAAFAEEPGTPLAGALEVFDTNNWGTSYEVPVGEDLPDEVGEPDTADDEAAGADNQMFEYTGILVMAANDGTVVDIDADADGTIDPNGADNVAGTGDDERVTLNEGESFLFDGGVNVGATVNSTDIVQVDLITGDINAFLGTRWFTLLPTDQFSDTYYTPVFSTKLEFPRPDATFVWVYNPSDAAIDITLDTLGNSETFSLASGTAQRRTIPLNSGAKVSSSEDFYALSTIDSDADQSLTHDWGFTLIPEANLTSQVLIGLGSGQDPTLPFEENSSPVWVTPVGNGTTPVDIYVDYNGDGIGALTDPNGFQYDELLSLQELESARVFDSDGDQTGMLLYTIEPGVSLAAAWGQDGGTASAGIPAFDVGTGLPPLPEFAAGKNGTVLVDADGDGLASPGDTLLYTINILNISRVPVPDVNLIDIIPTDTAYVPGTTQIDYGDGNGFQTIFDATTDTPFPLDGSGLNLNSDITAGTEPGALPAGGEFTVTFQVEIDEIADLTPGTDTIVNNAVVSAQGTDLEITDDTPLNFEPAVDLQKTVALGHDSGASFGSSGESAGGVNGTSVTYYFEVINTGDTFLDSVVVDDPDLGISTGDLTLLSGATPLAPGETVVYFYETTINGDLINTADVTANPTFANGSDLDVDDDGQTGPDDNVTGEDTAQVGEVQTGSIAGTVTDSDDAPLENVAIALLDENGQPVLDANSQPITTTTDANGDYIFTDVQPGNYQVQQTNLPDYVDVNEADGLNDGGDDTDGGDNGIINNIPVILSPGENDTGNDFIDEIATGSISGTVTDSDNAPLENVAIALLDENGQPVLDANSQPITTTTDANGDYIFTDVQPGNYQVQQTNLADYVDVSEADGLNDGGDDTDGGDNGIINNIPVILNPREEDTGNDFVDEVADPGLDIEKFTNGVDADTDAEAVEIAAGDAVTWTYQVTNTGNVTFAQNDIVITDDQEGIITDILDQGDGDGFLAPGETWTYQETGIAQNLVTLIDWETAPDGTPLTAGTFITDQYASVGLTVSATEFGAMIFDSANPTGGDTDLATDTLGNILIISEDGDPTDPDDNGEGGTITLSWENPIRFEDTLVLDVDEPGGTIVTFDADDNVISTTRIPQGPDNALLLLEIGDDLVSRIDYNFSGSGSTVPEFVLTDIYRNEVTASGDGEILDTDSSRYINPVEADDDTVPPQPPTEGLFFSVERLRNLNGVVVSEQDIVQFDGTNFNLFFDGTDVGLNETIDVISAFDVISENEILLSFIEPLNIPGVGSVNDSDVVLFSATSLGENTAGSFSLYFDGSDVGLSVGGEGIDALTLLEDNSLLFSTEGTFNDGNGLLANSQDVTQFTPTSIGSNTAGSFELYFDGSDVGLGAENVDALAVDADGNLLLSPANDFGNSGVSGEGDEDILSFAPNSLGANTSGSLANTPFLDGSQFGLLNNDIKGVDLNEPDEPVVPSAEAILFTVNNDITLDGVTITDQDIARYDGDDYSLFFDGSDVGLPTTSDINAFDVISETEILLSFSNPVTLAGVGDVDDSDVVLFTATSLGDTTAGTFSLVFDGSDVGLSNSGEDINAIVGRPDGSLLISVVNNLNPGSGTIAANEDIVQFTPTATGANTAGTFSLFFDGSDVGLDASAVNSFGIDANGDLLFSPTGNVTVDGVAAENEDILAFTPTATGANTSGSFASELYFDGSENGLDFRNVEGFDVTFENFDSGNTGSPESLSLSLNPTSVSEGDVSTATVTRTGDTSAALTVNLSSSDTTEATVGNTITIAAGQTSATFPVNAVDDSDVDGTQTATITAAATGLTSGTASLEVTDNDVAPGILSLSLAPDSIAENGGVSTATVTRTGDLSAALTVNLSSSDTTEALVGSPVTIAAGQASATFPINAVDDSDVDGTQTAIITAAATGLTSGTANLMVTDDEVAPTPDGFLLTVNNDVTLNGLTVTDQDIARFDGTDYSLFFDGSDVGLPTSSDINAFDAISDTEILMSFNNPVTLAGVGEVDDSDILLFTATSLGDTTAGTFSLVFDGSDVGLGNNGEDIDAIVGLPDGSLLVSVLNTLNPGSGTIAANEDIVQFTPTSTGANTDGTFSLFFDGSDVGLASSAVNGFSLDAAGDLFFSLTGNATVGGTAVENEDILAFTPTGTGDNTSGSFDSTLFFDGSANALDFRNVEGIDLTFSEV